jgi:hypothetical protein
VNQLRAISAIARADFRERVRRYSVLLTLLFAVFLGYAAATGRISIQLGEYRGVYTSAWIGALVAITTTCCVSLVGFYIVKSAIDRDRQTGVGQILAATPLSKAAYTLGKFVSNFIVLASMVVVLAIAAVLMQLFVGEDPHVDVVALLAPFVLVALPAMILTAALAVLFETLPVLRGGLGNVAWFFVWSTLGIGLPEISGVLWLDPMGIMTVSRSMIAGARANIPGYKDSFAFTIADRPAAIVHSFHWQGVPWTSADVLLRLAWSAVAVSFVLVAAIAFDRFDTSCVFAPSLRKAKPAAVPEGMRNAAATSLPAVAGTKAPTHLSPLAASTHRIAFGRLFFAEVCLALKGMRWWWYAVAAGLLVAQFVAPLQAARGPIVGSAWMWLVLVWSGMGARESRFGTSALLFSSPRILRRQIPGCWLAGVAIAIVLGAWSGSGKPFEGLLTALLYVGPVNRSSGIDFTGTASGHYAIHDAVIYFALSAALVTSVFVRRARQLRSN